MKSLLPVTAVILTKNEERALPDCVASVAFCEQVVVVDSHSEDRTREIARSAGADVVDFSWDGGYPKKKQWSLQHDIVRNQWVLMLDADERVSRDLADEITALVTSGSLDGNAAYDVNLDYVFAGRQLRHGHRVSKRILLDRSRCSFPVMDDLGATRMWEVEGHYQPQVRGRIASLSGRLLHADPDPLFDYIARHNMYSDWEAHVSAASTRRSAARASRNRGGRLFERLPAKPLVFFLYSYVVRAGFRDGRAGLDYALAQAFYYWQISAKVRERERSAASTGPS